MIFFFANQKLNFHNVKSLIYAFPYIADLFYPSCFLIEAGLCTIDVVGVGDTIANKWIQSSLHQQSSGKVNH